MKLENLVKLAELLNDNDTQPTKEKTNMGKHIVILQRGWVMVGDLSKDESYYTLKNCSVIRRWGTSNGLGELAEKGKLDETVLDKAPDTFFHELTTIAFIKCDENNW